MNSSGAINLPIDVDPQSIYGALATFATFPLDIAPVMELLEAVGLYSVVWVTTF